MLKDVINRLNSYESSLEELAKKALSENVEYILYLIKEKQLGEGIMSDGGSAPSYSVATDMIANNAISMAIGGRPRKDKVAGQPWNYEWSGNWIDSLYVKIENEGFDILARDSKTQMLESMSGGRITKLTEEHNEMINNEVIIPYLYKEFESTLLF